MKRLSLILSLSAPMLVGVSYGQDCLTPLPITLSEVVCENPRNAFRCPLTTTITDQYKAKIISTERILACLQPEGSGNTGLYSTHISDENPGVEGNEIYTSCFGESSDFPWGYTMLGSYLVPFDGGTRYEAMIRSASPESWTDWTINLNDFLIPGELGPNEYLSRIDNLRYLNKSDPTDLGHHEIIAWGINSETYEAQMYVVDLGTCLGSTSYVPPCAPQGVNLSTCESWLQSEGLNLGIVTYTETDGSCGGEVLSTNPVSESLVLPGSTVDVEVCTAPTISSEPIVVEAEYYESSRGVNIECIVPNSSNGCNIGYTDAGDWASYKTSQNNSTTEWAIRVRYAAWRAGQSLTIVNIKSGESTTLHLPSTGGLPNWQLSASAVLPVNTDSSLHIRVKFNTGEINLDYIELTQSQ